jgi:hypothetical protein
MRAGRYECVKGKDLRGLFNLLRHVFSLDTSLVVLFAGLRKGREDIKRDFVN